jgi:hypothetical protein
LADIDFLAPEGRSFKSLRTAGRPGFASGDWFDGSDEEFRAEAGGYIAYSGPYTVNEEDQTLSHTMEVSLFPNWMGQTQPRIVSLEGDTLRLSTAAPFRSNGRMDNSYLSWQRVG